MLFHSVDCVLEHVGMHRGVNAVGEGDVGDGPDLVDLVVPQPFIHKDIVMNSSHSEQLPGCTGLPVGGEPLEILQECLRPLDQNLCCQLLVLIRSVVSQPAD